MTVRQLIHILNLVKEEDKDKTVLVESYDACVGEYDDYARTVYTFAGKDSRVIISNDFWNLAAEQGRIIIGEMDYTGNYFRK